MAHHDFNLRLVRFTSTPDAETEDSEEKRKPHQSEKGPAPPQKALFIVKIIIITLLYNHFALPPTLTVLPPVSL